MTSRRLALSAIGLVLLAWPLVAVAPGAEAKKIREPAVAGLFYPRDAAALAQTVETLLAAAKEPKPGELKALICPHAGYSYSGPVAASGFAALRGKNFRSVVLLAPAHYARLRAASVSDADVFRTPLGDVPVSPKARELARTRPFELEPRCAVERPDWAVQSSRAMPARELERADTWEHADEVEVPFLQKTLGRFELLPVVMGDVDAAATARALEPLLDAETLVVVSSDLSHYHAYADARERDLRCIKAICSLDLADMAGEEACGRVPILTLMRVAQQRGWKPVLLDYRNSGDTSGDKSSVVGYAAIAFYAPESAPAEKPKAAATLTPDERRYLLALARQTVRDVAGGGPVPEIPAREVNAELAQPKACFVTLTKRGELRGCIGHLSAIMPLYRAVIDNARNAALRDPRFPSVAPREVDELEIEISVLTEPQPLAFASPEDLLAKLQPGVDGVVLRIGSHVATYLPQVWEQIPDKVEFLDRLAEKAGARAGDWRGRNTAVSIYHVESFKEGGT
jgi:AmmeMemoRadiSam system protein B/AmmeMemoRadiSam system protein A